jgi:UDP-N-acetyl-D-glucosamine dehydrogenase
MAIGIVGLGYVGLPLALAFARTGEDVIGVDADARRVAALRRGESYVEDVDADDLRSATGRLHATTRPAALAPCEAVVLCVPTPLSANREPDLSAIVGAARSLAGILQPGQLVSLESTSYPGTTRERLVPLLEESGLCAGREFNVAYSPERIDPGRTDHSLRTTPKLVAGLTPACAERAIELYSRVCERVVPVSTLEAAELAKLLENIFRSVNIALVNELWLLAERMGIDIWEVIDAASTKPYGFMRFEPGPGMGGHCLPVDPFYLSWKAREYDFCTEFIELAGKVNADMPYRCVERVERALNDAGRAVRGARILVLGVSYKPGVADTRESPAMKILGLLRDRGARVAYHDPHVPELPELGLRSQPLLEAAGAAELAVIATAHPSVDHAAVADLVGAVVDLRGTLRTQPHGVRAAPALVEPQSATSAAA